MKTALRRAALAFTAALALSAIASPALADWQWTRWGMTPAEVTAAAAGKVRQTEPQTLVLTEPVTVAGIEFPYVGFRFEEGGLQLVAMQASFVHFDRIDGALAAAYGPAIASSPSGPNGKSRTYLDRAGGNTIALEGGGRYSGGQLSVTYRPVPTGF